MNPPNEPIKPTKNLLNPGSYYEHMMLANAISKFDFTMSHYCTTMLSEQQTCKMTDLVDAPIMNNEHKDAGKQASLMMGPVDLPYMNNEPKDAGKQASLMMGPVDLPSINHEPMNHMNCTDEHMNNSTTENKLAVRHARQIFDPWTHPQPNTTIMDTMTRL